MCHTFIKVIFLQILLLVSFAVEAGGIYHCLDKYGSYIFRDQPCPAVVKKGEMAVHDVWQELKKLVREGRDMTANQQSNVDSILRCKTTQRSLMEKLTALKERVNSVAGNNRYLLSAYEQIPQCLDCRAAASYYCGKVDANLDGALNQRDLAHEW